jgi:hypothetical protein
MGRYRCADTGLTWTTSYWTPPGISGDQPGTPRRELRRDDPDRDQAEEKPGSHGGS